MTTITESTINNFHHLPQHQSPVELEGLSLRRALNKLRQMYFNGLGGMHSVKLSDGSYLSVDNVPSSEPNTSLMDVHQALRDEWDNGVMRTIKKYKI